MSITHVRECRLQVLVGLLAIHGGCVNDDVSAEVAIMTETSNGTESRGDETSGGTTDETAESTHSLWIGTDSDSWQSELAAVLLNQQGGVASPVVHIVDEDQTHVYDRPTVSFDGLGYLVVWQQQGGIFGQRVTQAGDLEGTHIAIVEEQDIAHVATTAITWWCGWRTANFGRRG